MKVGAENRNTVVIAVVLAVVAVFMLWRTFFSGGGPVAAAPPASSQPSVATNAGPAARRIVRGRKTMQAPGQPTVAAGLDPRLRLDLLKVSEETEYKGGGRNIFDKQSEIVIPPTITPPVREKKEDNKQAEIITPPPPQPLPPINMKAFGLLNRPGEPRQVFLLQNDDVFVAKEGDVVNRRYKVVKINNTSVEIEDLLSNNTQTIPVTAS